MAVNRYGPFVAHNSVTGLPSSGAGSVYAYNDPGCTVPLTVTYNGSPVTVIAAAASGYVGLVEVTVVPGTVEAGEPVWWKSGSAPALPINPIGGGAGGPHAASHTQGGSDEITIEQDQVTGLPGTLGNVVVIRDPGAARVHPITGADLDPDVVLIWDTATEPTNILPDDIWMRAVQVDVVGVDATASGSAASTHQVTLPAGLLDGDTVLLWTAYADAAVTAGVSGVSGFVEEIKESPTGLTTYTWSKADAGPAESGQTVTVTLSASRWAVVVCAVLRGAAPVDPVDGTAAVSAASGTSRAVATLAASALAAELQVVSQAAPASGAPSTQTLSPTGDAYTDSANPTTVYNTTQMWVRTSGPEMRSYLGFTLPAAPAGESLVGARLRVRTTTDGAAGSAAAIAVNLGSGAWAETTLNHNNRPTLSTALGTLPADSTSDTEYLVDLDEAVLAPLLGTAVTVALSTTGPVDGFGIWSREYAVSAHRPALQLDFAPAAQVAVPVMPGGMIELVSAASGAGAGASGVAVRVGYFDLLARISGTQFGGDVWTVQSAPQTGVAIALKALA